MKSSLHSRAVFVAYVRVKFANFSEKFAVYKHSQELFTFVVTKKARLLHYAKIGPTYFDLELY